MESPSSRGSPGLIPLTASLPRGRVPGRLYQVSRPCGSLLGLLQARSEVTSGGRKGSLEELKRGHVAGMSELKGPGS